MTRARRLGFALLALPIVAGLIWLGLWQLERRSWKLALIAQVERRLAAPPVVAPPPAAWPRLGPADAYTRLRADGTYLRGRTTFVQAVTDLGAGYWVMEPLVTERGFTILVNRGFVPADMRGTPFPVPPGPVEVTGLLRLTEPHGGFLRANRPGTDQWHSRDVAAIAARRGLTGVAPYFIDADARTSPAWPRGGLTVVRFRNAHLQYALTWFALAIGLAGATAWVLLRDRED